MYRNLDCLPNTKPELLDEKGITAFGGKEFLAIEGGELGVGDPDTTPTFIDEVWDEPEVDLFAEKAEQAVSDYGIPYDIAYQMALDGKLA